MSKRIDLGAAVGAAAAALEPDYPTMGFYVCRGKVCALPSH